MLMNSDNMFINSDIVSTSNTVLVNNRDYSFFPDYIKLNNPSHKQYANGIVEWFLNPSNKNDFAICNITLWWDGFLKSIF
jgi:hypothetical protein